MKEELHIYSRVSTTTQEEEGTSLGNQEKLGRDKAKQLDMIPVIHNEGGMSASDESLDNRVVIFNLLEKMKLGEVKNLFVYNNDRLSRSTTTFTIIRKHIRENGVTLYTPTGKVNLEDDRDDLMFGILGEFAQYENRIRRTRLIQGKRARVLQGGWQGGAEPFGYRNENGKLVVDENESKWVKKIFKWWGEGKPPMYIKLQLDGNILTRRKKPVWSIGSIEAILKLTHYIGYYFYKEDRIEMPRILTDEEYEPVRVRRNNLLLNLERRKPRNGKNNSYILTSLLTCGMCGGNIGGHHQHGRYSYICISKKKQYKEKYTPQEEKYDRNRGCYMNKGVELFSLEKFVMEVVYEVVKYSNMSKNEFKKKIMKNVEKDKTNYNDQIKSYERDSNRKSNTLKAIDKRLGDLELELIDEEITKTRYNIISETLVAQSNTLTKKIKDNKINMESLASASFTNQPVDWYDMYKKDVESMSDIKGDDILEKLKQYVEGISIYLDEYKEHHIIKINFKYPIVNDKIIWNNKEDIDNGYTIREGRKTKLLFLKKKQRVRATRWFTPARLGEGISI